MEKAILNLGYLNFPKLRSGKYETMIKKINLPSILENKPPYMKITRNNQLKISTQLTTTDIWIV